MKIKELFSNPTVRLALRAVVAAALTALTQIHAQTGGTVAWHAVAVGAGLAFLEVFTPLNGLVGLWKQYTETKIVTPVTPVKPAA